MQPVYRGIVLGYPAGTTNMEELENQGHERSIPMAGVSFPPFPPLPPAASLNNIQLDNAPTGFYGHSLPPSLGCM
jgi:hypothetical protein